MCCHVPGVTFAMTLIASPGIPATFSTVRPYEL